MPKYLVSELASLEVLFGEVAAPSIAPFDP